MTKFGDTNTQDTLAGLPAGGTAGQALTKTTGADYDAGWAAVGGGTGPTGLVASFINTTGLGSLTGSSTNTGITIINAPVTAGRYYVVNVLFSYTANAAMSYTFQLNDGTNSWQILSTSNPAAATATSTSGSLLYVPATTGLKTLKLDATRVSGSGTFGWGADANHPVQLVLTDIGGTAPPPDTGKGLIASHVLTTSFSQNGNSIVDTLTCAFTGIAGATYKASLTTPFTKSDAATIFNVQIAPGGYGTMIPAIASGEINGSIIFTAAGAVTVSVVYFFVTPSGIDKTLTLPGSATAPRQLWVERIA